MNDFLIGISLVAFVADTCCGVTLTFFVLLCQPFHQSRLRLLNRSNDPSPVEN